MLGKLIVTPVNLLLLDEPTNHLDMDSCDSLLAAIDAFEGAVVIVTHNEMFLHSLATRFIVFDRGRARVFDGSYQDFLDTVGWESDDDSKPTSHGPSRGAPRVAAGGAAPEGEPPSAEARMASPRGAAGRQDPRGQQMPAEKKTDRQARAKFVQERAKIVGPLEKRVAQLETLIVTLERDRDNTFTALADASARGDARIIAELSKKSGDITPQIEWAYDELEKVTIELDQARARFDNAA